MLRPNSRPARKKERKGKKKKVYCKARAHASSERAGAAVQASGKLQRRRALRLAVSQSIVQSSAVRARILGKGSGCCALLVCCLLYAGAREEGKGQGTERRRAAAGVGGRRELLRVVLGAGLGLARALVLGRGGVGWERVGLGHDW
ncbi:hypothetical protein BS50DRAFT_78639 [Corynespora cassiicola Philippines]|uniref:Uncharacterized protein n=1 Tax=Corynespora cassiicola Philippines TaxID=1448308 RepID=A0A2T2NGR6_CORCC|nr:hypothetical protein BS50DRAFT_78639 [Corynespora cassiicola Philippines]